MNKKVSSLSGFDAASTLESIASSELKQVRQLVEQAVEADLAAYFKAIGAGDPSPNVLTGLVTAAIAGGQLGFTNLVTRLGVSDLKIKNIETAANEILSLVYRHTSILNNIRLKISVVQSIVKALAGKNLNQSGKQELDQILTYRISNQSDLDGWAEDAEEFFQKQAAVTGSVNSRSISTYSKLWNSYLNEKILPFLGIKTNLNNIDSVSNRIKPLIKYKEPNKNQVKQLLINDQKHIKFVSKSNQNINKLKSSKLVLKKDLGGRFLQITYNSPGIDPELIQPVLSSVKGQMLADPNQTKISVDMSNEVSQVFLEIERPKKEDLATLKIQLGSLAYGL